MESIYYPLFELMSQEHDVTLLDSESEDIIQVCLEIEKNRQEQKVDSSGLLSAILEKMAERQVIIQEAFYKNDSLVNELRAKILLDLTVVLRDAINDFSGR